VGISKTNPKKKTQLQFSCNRWEVVCHWVKGPLPFFFPSTPCRWNHQFWCNFDWKSWKTIATYKSSVVVDMGICVSLFFLFLIFLCTFFSKFMACLLIKFSRFHPFKVPTSSIQSPNEEFTIIDFHGPQLTTLDLENVVPHGGWVLDPMSHGPAKATTPSSCGVCSTSRLVQVMPNIWPGFVDQVVDKWMNEWMVVLKVQRDLHT